MTHNFAEIRTRRKHVYTVLYVLHESGCTALYVRYRTHIAFKGKHDTNIKAFACQNGKCNSKYLSIYLHIFIIL